MNYEQLIGSMTADMYKSIRAALEIGKWPHGVAMTAEQKTICIEAILHYENQHDLPADQRVGYISQSCNSGANKDESNDPDLIKILNH